MKPINKMSAIALLLRGLGLLVCLGIPSLSYCQTATALKPVLGPDSLVCVPITQLQDVAADLAELDQRRATADSAKKAVLTLQGQGMQLTVANDQLRQQNKQLQLEVRRNRGQSFRDSANTIGNTALKIGGVVLALWIALRHF